MDSPRFTLNKQDLTKVLTGLGIAMAGAALTYLTQFFAKTDFGVWTPVVVTVWSVFVNAARKFLSGPEA